MCKSLQAKQNNNNNNNKTHTPPPAAAAAAAASCRPHLPAQASERKDKTEPKSTGQQTYNEPKPHTRPSTRLAGMDSSQRKMRRTGRGESALKPMRLALAVLMAVGVQVAVAAAQQEEALSTQTVLNRLDQSQTGRTTTLFVSSSKRERDYVECLRNCK